MANHRNTVWHFKYALRHISSGFQPFDFPYPNTSLKRTFFRNEKQYYKHETYSHKPMHPTTNQRSSKNNKHYHMLHMGLGDFNENQ